MMLLFFYFFLSFFIFSSSFHADNSIRRSMNRRRVYALFVSPNESGTNSFDSALLSESRA